MGSRERAIRVVGMMNLNTKRRTTLLNGMHMNE
jgi:hypothetical protein